MFTIKLIASSAQRKSGVIQTVYKNPRSQKTIRWSRTNEMTEDLEVPTQDIAVAGSQFMIYKGERRLYHLFQSGDANQKAAFKRFCQGHPLISCPDEDGNETNKSVLYPQNVEWILYDEEVAEEQSSNKNKKITAARNKINMLFDSNNLEELSNLAWGLKLVPSGMSKHVLFNNLCEQCHKNPNGIIGFTIDESNLMTIYIEKALNLLHTQEPIATKDHLHNIRLWNDSIKSYPNESVLMNALLADKGLWEQFKKRVDEADSNNISYMGGDSVKKGAVTPLNAPTQQLKKEAEIIEIKTGIDYQTAYQKVIDILKSDNEVKAKKIQLGRVRKQIESNDKKKYDFVYENIFEDVCMSLRKEDPQKYDRVEIDLRLSPQIA